MGSSAYEMIRPEVQLSRSLMKIRKRTGHRTDSCGTTELIGFGKEQWQSATTAIKRSDETGH